ncbi:uncharacterized protein LOC123509860 isoform X1 [Portunus trituberculatus]|uniref:uncharacterized protein LOC123509860 isoform X1 n=1 Tax=Portunus trituberculatus TaxID=210409 RepID=UPI001E1D0018|nr:uncharacterized protein LOC123509860 isoform X1 [Portunus trituberculatus]
MQPRELTIEMPDCAAIPEPPASSGRDSSLHGAFTDLPPPTVPTPTPLLPLGGGTLHGTVKHRYCHSGEGLCMAPFNTVTATRGRNSAWHLDPARPTPTPTPAVVGGQGVS